MERFIYMASRVPKMGQKNTLLTHYNESILEFFYRCS